MTERNPPTWLQAGTYPAEDDRRLLSTIFADSEGIVGASTLAVTQRALGVNMSVDVAGGRAIVKGDLGTFEGVYHVDNRNLTNLTVAASDPTNPRIDLVVAEVLNAEYSGVSNLWRLRVITGVPAGSPVAPTLPSNALALATIAVAASASSVVNANITDLRQRAWLYTGVVPCTSTTRPTAPTVGMSIYEIDTQRIKTWNASIWQDLKHAATSDAPAVKAVKIASQSFTSGVETAVVFGGESYDTHGMHSTVSNTDRLTVPAGYGGLYAVDAYVFWDAAAAGPSTRQMKLAINGVAGAPHIWQLGISAGWPHSQTLHTELRLNPGDFIGLACTQDSGGAVTMNGTGQAAHFCARWVAP